MEIDGVLWLFDTGSPKSFGEENVISLDQQACKLSKHFAGLSADTLSRFIGVECRGLIGTDILGKFDHLIDVSNGNITISTSSLEHSGTKLPLSEMMGVPLLKARIANNEYLMFFDIGAEISYFQEDSITDFPSAGSVSDFYPGVGEFQTETHHVQAMLGEHQFDIRCGTLPSLLGATLSMMDVSGIIGNQMIRERLIGYFPRRNVLCL